MPVRETMHQRAAPPDTRLFATGSRATAALIADDRRWPTRVSPTSQTPSIRVCHHLRTPPHCFDGLFEESVDECVESRFAHVGCHSEVEFVDNIVETIIPDINELRIILTDGSFVNVWFSLKLQGHYSFHWERRAPDGKIYRHDNSPHKRWESVATFPKHFHDGSETNALESHLSEVPKVALREFLAFVLASTGASSSSS
jgi:Family of unknown function (DUF6516)